MKTVVNNFGALLLLLFAKHLYVNGDHTKIVRIKDRLEWLVNIEDRDGNFFCSGALISKDRIATSAHCVTAAEHAGVPLPFQAVFYKNGTKVFQRRRLKHYFITNMSESKYAEAVLRKPVMDIAPIRICSDNPTLEKQRLKAVEWGMGGKYTYINAIKLAVLKFTGNLSGLGPPSKIFLHTRNIDPKRHYFCKGFSGMPILAGLANWKYCLVGTGIGDGYHCKDGATTANDKWNYVPVMTTRIGKGEAKEKKEF